MKILVVQGAGMNMRGKVAVDVFGPATLAQINEGIMSYGSELGLDVEIMQSNVEGEVVDALFDAHERGLDAALINPAGFTKIDGLIPGAIATVRYPVIEVHASNPASRGVISRVLPSCYGSVVGFGTYSYYLGLLAARAAIESGE